MEVMWISGYGFDLDLLTISYNCMFDILEEVG